MPFTYFSKLWLFAHIFFSLILGLPRETVLKQHNSFLRAGWFQSCGQEHSHGAEASPEYLL